MLAALLWRRTSSSNNGCVFEFDYSLTGRGWSEARIADDDHRAIVTASCLSDALGSLVDVVALVLEGQPEARCSWEEEPGEFRWILRREADALSIEILAFDDLYSPAASTGSAPIDRWRRDVGPG